MKEMERKRIKEELNDLVAKRFAKVMIEKIDIQELDEIINGVNEKLGVQRAYMVLHSKIVLKLNELIEVVNDLDKKYRYPLVVLKDAQWNVVESNCEHDFGDTMLLSKPPQYKCIKCGIVVTKEVVNSLIKDENKKEDKR